MGGVLGLPCITLEAAGRPRFTLAKTMRKETANGELG